MALTYRSTLKGHVVQVPEPADIIAAAEAEAERLFRKGTKRDRLDAELIVDRARSRAMHQRQTLAKMDDSRRWERCTAPAVTSLAVPVQEQAPAPVPVLAAPLAAAESPPDAPTKVVKATAKAKDTEA